MQYDTQNPESASCELAKQCCWRTWQISQDTVLHVMCFHDPRQNLQGIAAGWVLWFNSYLELPEEFLTTASAFLGSHSLVSINRLCFFFFEVHNRTTSVSKWHLIRRLVTFSVVERFVLKSFRKNSWPLCDSLQLFLHYPSCHDERLLPSNHATVNYFIIKERKKQGKDMIKH